MLSMIVAIDENRNIGSNNDMPWGKEMKSDLQRFKQLTEGHVVVMGRKTLESIGRLLPNRTNIVLTSSPDNLPPDMIESGVITTTSIEEVLSLRELISKDLEFFIIGGGQIYEQFLPYVDSIYLTRVHYSFGGDTKFPSILGSWTYLEREKHEADEKNPYPYTFVTLKRKEE